MAAMRLCEWTSCLPCDLWGIGVLSRFARVPVGDTLTLDAQSHPRPSHLALCGVAL
jgi:hypothetical protein